MEILEGLGINWKILLGQIVNFLILFYLFKKFVAERFLEILKVRREKIKEGIEKEKRVEGELRKIRAEKEEVLKRAREKSLEILKKSEEMASKKAAQILAQAQKEGEMIIKKMKERGERELEEMKEKEKEKLLLLNQALLEKILKEKISLEKQEQLIDKFLTKIE